MRDISNNIKRIPFNLSSCTPGFLGRGGVRPDGYRSDSDSYGMPRSESEHKRSESEHKRSESEQDYARALVRAQLSVALRQ